MLDLYSMSADPNPSEIIRIDEVMRLTGLRRTMLYDLMRQGNFPAQIELGARAVGWYKHQVLDWSRNRPSAKRHHVAEVHHNRKAQSPPDTEIKRAPKMPNDIGTSQVANLAVKGPRAETLEAKSSEVRAATQLAGRRSKAIDVKEELRCLQDENARLRRLIADLMLKNDRLQSAVGGNAIAS